MIVRSGRQTGQLAALLQKFRTYGVRVQFASGQDRLKLHAAVLSALTEFQEKVANDAPTIHGRQ
jgi:hypothetical protein